MPANLRWAKRPGSLTLGSLIAALVITPAHGQQLTPMEQYYDSAEPLAPGAVVGAPTSDVLPANDPRAPQPGRVPGRPGRLALPTSLFGRTPCGSRKWA